MKRVLLDENIHQSAYRLFLEFDAQTIGYLGWSGVSNGKLLSLAEGKFAVLITADQNLKHQQNFTNRTIAVLVLATGRVDYIERNKTNIADAVRAIPPGTVWHLTDWENGKNP
jgi:hypothetical protein